MSRYLTKIEENYRFDTEAEAAAFIEQKKKDSRFTLSKYTSTLKKRKEKGEVVETWYAVTLVAEFNDEKDPISFVEVDYKVENPYGVMEEEAEENED